MWASTPYFEIGLDNHLVREIKACDRGPTLRYGGGHDDDEFGFRRSAELDRSEDWAAWQITGRSSSEPCPQPSSAGRGRSG
jgi:hypothetical protein